MIDMRASVAGAGLLLSVSLMSPALAQTAPADTPNDPAAVSVRQTDDGHGVLSFSLSIPRGAGGDADTLQATFDFGDTKGLGRDGKPVVNQDKSLIAITNYPATKTSYVHLFVRHPNGDLIAVNSVNQRVVKFLTGRWAKAAEYRLEATAITGRVMALSVFDYVKGNEAEEHRLKVSVGADGTLTLAR
jgi:hypothetical protein